MNNMCSTNPTKFIFQYIVICTVSGICFERNFSKKNRQMNMLRIYGYMDIKVKIDMKIIFFAQPWLGQ